MALLPLLAKITREVGLPNLDEDYGCGIHPCDIYRPRVAPLQLSPPRRFSPYERSLQTIRCRRDPKEYVTVGKDGFQVCIDVGHFKPNELTVKTVDNNVVVEGKHEEREDDYGYISRQFVRKYHLPKGYDAKDVISTVSTDGILTVKAPPPSKTSKGNERVVHIQQTGPAYLSVKNNEEEEPKNSKKTESKQ